MRINRRKDPLAPAAVGELCEAFTRRCRAQGVRVTTQRLAVYRTLAEDPSHPTADVIYQRLRGAMPALSPATVYRVLESLVRDGLVQRVSTTGGAGRFDANLTPHQHLICRVCGRMTDVQAPTVASSVVGRAAARARPRFVVEDVDIRIVGRCETCPPAARPGSGRTEPHATPDRRSHPGQRVARRQAQFDERRP